MEDVRDGVFVGVEADGGVGEKDVRDGERALRVGAGHERGARGGADGRGVVAGELATLGGHAVEMGRAVVGTEWADVTVAEIVDVDQDEIGARRIGGRCGSSNERQENRGEQDEGERRLSHGGEMNDKRDGTAKLR